MKELNISEEKEMKGGGLSLVGYFIIGGIIILISGVIEGYLNPKKCNVGD